MSSRSNSLTELVNTRWTYSIPGGDQHDRGPLGAGDGLRREIAGEFGAGMQRHLASEREPHEQLDEPLRLAEVDLRRRAAQVQVRAAVASGPEATGQGARAFADRRGRRARTGSCTRRERPAVEHADEAAAERMVRAQLEPVGDAEDVRVGLVGGRRERTSSTSTGGCSETSPRTLTNTSCTVAAPVGSPITTGVQADGAGVSVRRAISFPSQSCGPQAVTNRSPPPWGAARTARRGSAAPRSGSGPAGSRTAPAGTGRRRVRRSGRAHGGQAGGAVNVAAYGCDSNGTTSATATAPTPAPRPRRPPAPV